MSSATTIPEPTETPGPHSAHGNGHNPHLAHHFDTPEQQIASGKLGMWVFLATEILMFGGLFCAYSIYRHNHPDVFEYAHQWLSKPLGAINTIVLITSSLTMAWGVRLAQLGRQNKLILCLALTIIGGYIFMGIKSIEYKVKWEHSLGLGTANMYRPGPVNPADKESVPGGGAPAPGIPFTENKVEHAGGAQGGSTAEKRRDELESKPAVKPEAGTKTPEAKPQPATPPSPAVTEYFDPNAGSGDAAKVRLDAVPPAGLAPKTVEELHKRELDPEELEKEYNLLPQELDKKRTYTFFQIYFLMTGLHGIHVLVGMGLIFWILLRACPKPWRKTVKLLGLASVGVFLLYVGILVGSTGTWIIGAIVVGLAVLIGLLGVFSSIKPVSAASTGEFGPDYFAPVDLVGLYWHLVDLIWIFLFPLLYLIR
jgi:cytochrome c oxidase subunit 3